MPFLIAAMNPAVSIASFCEPKTHTEASSPPQTATVTKTNGAFQ